MKKEKRETKKRKIGLFMMLISFSLIPLIFSIILVSVTSIATMKKNLESSAEDSLFIVASNLASYCAENKITAINAMGYYDYLDSLKDEGIEMAIISDGMPCATSIKNENNYRIMEIDCDMEKAQSDTGEKTGYYCDSIYIDEKEYCAYYIPIMTNGEMTGVAFAGELRENVTGAIKSMMISFVTTAVFLIVLFALIALACSRALIRSFNNVGERINALSNGSLQKQKEYSSAVKEMSTLLDEAETMQQNLAGIIGQVKSISGEVVNNIAQVTELGYRSQDRAGRITTSMEELSDSTVKMTENVQDINLQMQEIGNCVNEISDSVIQLHGNSEKILETNQDAKQNMDTIMENSKEAVGAVEDIGAQISQTNESITEIDKAVGLILSISQRTKMLSLNASIEAARAGEQGKGFAVVAQQIRELSDQSAEGAEMIKNIAMEITDKSTQSVELAQRVHSFIMLEQENVIQTQQTYEELSRNINHSVEEIRSIADKTEYLTRYKEKVIGNVQDLSAISEQNAGCNAQVGENVRRILADVGEVNAHCNSMNGMARQLEESVAYFRVE